MPIRRRRIGNFVHEFDPVYRRTIEIPDANPKTGTGKIYGIAGAQYHPAASYAVGDEIHRDFRNAAKWYRRAAKGGSAEASYKLGWMYLLGEGMRADTTAGLKSLRRASGADDAG